MRLFERYLDGAYVLGVETEVALDGGVGIVAIGLGTFTYDAFAVLRP